MKWQSNTNFEARAMAEEYRRTGLTYADIGICMGISRQRVQTLVAPRPWTKKQLYERANGNCELCGRVVGKSGHIHHKWNNPDTDYNSLGNIQLLCLSCHMKQHNGRGKK